MNQKSKLIILLEDDKPQRLAYAAKIEEMDLGSVRPICCATEFLDAYEQRPTEMPALFVIDLMIDWHKKWIKTARPLLDPPLKNDETALYCVKKVREYSKDVPIIIWTITDLRPDDIMNSPNTYFLRKDLAIEGDLCKLIRDLMRSD